MNHVLIKKILVVLYALSTIWWLTIFARGIQNTIENYLFNIPMALLPVLAGAYGLHFILIKKSVIQRLRFQRLAVVMISLALLSWGFGNLVYFIYEALLHTPAPLTSWADMWFAASLFFWIIGLALIYGVINRFLFILKSLFHFCLFGAASAFVLWMFFILLAQSFTVPKISIHFLLNVLVLAPDVVVILEIGLLSYFAFFKKQKVLVPFLYFIIPGFIIHYFTDLNYIFYGRDYFYASWLDMLFFTAAFLESLGLIALTQIQPLHKQKL